MDLLDILIPLQSFRFKKLLVDMLAQSSLDNLVFLQLRKGLIQASR
jgi:hypothetical protein